MLSILGLDFGGTKLAAGLVDPASGAVLRSTRCPTPPGGAPASLAAMLALAHGLLRAPSADPRSSGSILSAVGVSFGGPVAPDGRTVRRSMHVPGWEDFPLAGRLEAELGVPAAVANDGDAAALAEQRFGAGRGVGTLLYITVSTGIGGGVIVGGQLHRGEHAWAGEFGHMPLLKDGPPCRTSAPRRRRRMSPRRRPAATRRPARYGTKPWPGSAWPSLQRRTCSTPDGW